jgi:NADPH:quinone reductase-like Zn-dependent oxidoreductase
MVKHERTVARESEVPGQPARRESGDPARGWRVDSAGFRRPHVVELFPYDEGELPPGQFRVRTLYSGISAGTELTHFTGTNPYLHARWDPDLRLFTPDGSGAGYPFRISGYMESGRVVASRLEGVRDGQRLALSYGHKTGHTCDPLHDVFIPLPEELDPLLGIYVCQMGPVAANGILHADEDEFGAAVPALGAGVRDRHVVVTGAGIVGLLTALMAQAAGAREVAVVDRNPYRLAIVERLGLTPVDNRETDPGEWAKRRWKTDWLERGADVAFQCSPAAELLQQAFRCLRPQGTVIDLGFYQDGAPALQLGHEFHHNGLRHLCAQIGRVPRRLRATWDRSRLAVETIRFLQRRGADIRRHLITDVIPFTRAQAAFDMLAGESPRALQVLLDFS